MNPCNITAAVAEYCSHAHALNSPPVADPRADLKAIAYPGPLGTICLPMYPLHTLHHKVVRISEHFTNIVCLPKGRKNAVTEVQKSLAKGQSPPQELEESLDTAILILQSGSMKWDK